MSKTPTPGRTTGATSVPADALHLNVPSVEDRFIEIEQSLALLLMLAHAAGEGGDLGLSEEDESAAWYRISDLLWDALKNLRAIQGAAASVLGNPAPNADEVRA